MTEIPAYGLIVFDLDGTLLDTSEGIIHAIDETVRRQGKEYIPREIIGTFIGPPIYNSFQNHYGLTDDEALVMMNVFRDLYANVYLSEARVYDGIKGLLAHLKSRGFKTAVATNKRDDYTHSLMDMKGLSKYFDVINGSDFFNKMTKADIIVKCLEDTGCSASEALMVGDSEGDLKGARKAGTDFVGVGYGFGFKSGTDGIYICPDAEDLRDYIDGEGRWKTR